LTPGCEFDPIARVKYVLPLLVAVVFALAACKTTSDRRDLYSPTKPSGPATAELRDWTLFGGNNHKSTTYTYAVSTSAASPEAGPIAPPPPAPPDTSAPDIGAPEATPVPGEAPMPVPRAPKYTPGPVTPAAPQSGGDSGGIPMATPADAGGGGSDSGGGGGGIPGLSQ
jgi:hypothetical protein